MGCEEWRIAITLGMYLLTVGKGYSLNARQGMEVNTQVLGTEEKLSRSDDQGLLDSGEHWQSESVAIPVKVAGGMDFRVQA